MANTVNKHAGWRIAVRLFSDQKKKEGDVLSFAWLYDAFGMTEPQDATPWSERKASQLQFLGNIKAFEAHLLEELQIAIKNVRGIGYEVLAASEQSKWAYDEALRDVKRGVKKGLSRLTNVNLSSLTADQRRENADALAKIAALRGMVKSSDLQERIPNALGHAKD